MNYHTDFGAMPSFPSLPSLPSFSPSSLPTFDFPTDEWLEKADKWARSTGYAPGSAVGMSGVDKPYLPPKPTKQEEAAFWQNPPLTFINYVVRGSVDFFTVFLKRLIKRTGRKSLRIKIPGPPGKWNIPNVAKKSGTYITLDLQPYTSDSLVSLSAKVLGWFFCCGPSMFFEVNRMLFVLPTGRAGPLGDYGVASGPVAATTAGGTASGPASGALVQKEVTEHAVDEGAKGMTFWGLVQTFGPTILDMVCKMILGATSGGSIQDQQVSAATSSLKQGDPGAFAAGSGSGAGSSSSFPLVPVAMVAVGLSLFGVYFFSKKKG